MGASVNPEDLEFLISQYLDGTLAPTESAEVERLVAEGGDAFALLAEYRQIDATLKAAPMGVPEVRWEDFAVRISSAVADQAADDAASGEQAAKTPVRSYRMPWVRSTVVRWAIAAAVVLGTGLGIFVYRGRSNGPSIVYIPPPAANHGPVVDLIEGPRAEAPAGTPSDEIEIGPPSGAVAEGQPSWQRWHSSQAVVTGGARVVIASGDATAQDNSAQSPY